MTIRFFKRVKIFPGLTVNLSKNNVSVSAGPRGARFTTGTAGNRVTAGLTGTGLYYTQKLKKNPPKEEPPEEEDDKIIEKAVKSIGCFIVIFFISMFLIIVLTHG